MNLLWLLFLLQTFLLIASYHFRFPVFFDIDFNALIYKFQTGRLHQGINVVFLVAIWVQHWKRLVNMFYFLVKKNIKISAFILLVYLALLFFYLEFLPKDYLYRNGMILVVTGGIVAFPYLFPKVIGRKKIKIQNPKGFIEDEDGMSFELYGKGWKSLPINDPQKGILIVGGVGSGKTKSLMEPILFKMIRRGYAGILYDFKFSPKMGRKNVSLTHLAYHCLENFTGEVKPKFFSINFQDLTTTARFNPIAPQVIKDRIALSQAIETLMDNLNPTSAKKNDFWHLSTIALLKSIIIFLSNQHPACCTLPHAIKLGLQDSATLLSAISSDDEAKDKASSVIDAHQRAPEQFAGVISSFKTSLDKLLDETIFWILSGKDPLPVVNDPANPSMVCLGNTAVKSETFSPILAMLTSMMISKLYDFGRNKSFVIIDELPTIHLPNLSKTLAIGREYKICVVAGFQNLGQMVTRYGRDEAKELRSTFSNLFFGKGDLEDAKYLTDFIGKEVVEEASVTESEERESKTTHQKEHSIISPQDVMKFESGEFMGKVVHEEGGFFHMKLEPLEVYNWKLNPKRFKPLPVVSKHVDTDANLRKIQEEVEEIASLYRKAAKPMQDKEEQKEYEDQKRVICLKE